MRTLKKPSAAQPQPPKVDMVSVRLPNPPIKGVSVVYNEGYGDYFIECRTAKASRDLIRAIWANASR